MFSVPRRDTRRESQQEPGPVPFLLYASEVLGPLITGGVLLRGGRPVRMTGLRYRNLGPDLEPVWAAQPRLKSHDSPIFEAHLAALLRLSLPDVSKVADAEGSQSLGFKGDGSVPVRFVSRVEGSESQDYVFRFNVPPEPAPRSLAEYCARATAILLDVVELIDESGPVIPDEARCEGQAFHLQPTFSLGPFDLGPRDQNQLRSRDRHPLTGIAATTPALAALGRHWGLLVAYRPDCTPGGTTALEGFQLRRAADWVVSSSCHPSELYQHLARVCNVACSFCYLFGNPQGISIARGSRVASRDEIRTRLRYYDPPSKRALFPALWEINEFLIDPQLPELLQELRRRTTQSFDFITNGNPLTPRVIDLLATVKPVHVIVSTNTFDAELRSTIMHERAPQTRTALDCLSRLRAESIPFGVSLVALPELTPEQLVETILRTDDTSPGFIRVNLPGFTRQHPYSTPFDTDTLWQRTVTLVKELRGRVRTPLLTIPSAYEENFFHSDPNAARVLGVIVGSPAEAAGLRAGDVITRVGSFGVRVRSEAQSLLLLARRTLAIEVQRDGRRQTVTVDSSHPPVFPYTGPVCGKYLFPLGVVLAPALSVGDIDTIREALRALDAQRGWVVTSSVMLPAAVNLLRGFAPDLVDRIHFVVCGSEFLGGNIRVLDMCTIDDIARSLQRELVNEAAPDVILVSATGFNAGGRDLAGRHWQDLERGLSIPVRLLHRTSQFLF